LTRLIAPILSFTAEEVWALLPKVEGREASVHLALFPAMAEIIPGSVKVIEEEWGQLLEWRDSVLKQMETLRADKTIGKSLEARVTVSRFDESDDHLFRVLEKYRDSLAELLGVSEVAFHEVLNVSGQDGIVSGVSTSVHRATGTKCERCWRYVSDVGSSVSYPSVCLRCAEALEAIAFPPYEATEGNA
jgi:isoleucyl-tRNA synthetase